MQDDSASANGAARRRDMPEKVQFEPVGEIVSIYRRGDTWYTNYQLEGRQHRRSLQTTSLKEARRRALLLEADILSGRHKARTEVATIAEAIAAYKQFLRTEKRAPLTISKYDMVLDRVLAMAKALNAKTLDRLNLTFLDRYRAGRVKLKKADKTVYGEAIIIRQLINFALKRDLVFQDPLKGLKLKKPKAAPQPCWTFEETSRILAESQGDVRAALTLLAETGLRFGELAWLTWEDVDPENKRLSIRPKEGWKPKTGDQRAIPLSPVAASLLASLPRRGRWVATMPPTQRQPQSGRQWTERRLLAALQQILKKVGLRQAAHIPALLHQQRADQGGGDGDSASVGRAGRRGDHQTLYAHSRQCFPGGHAAPGRGQPSQSAARGFEK